jgi:dTDP-4-amino-4,6-dideoxygalactose transaminase
MGADMIRIPLVNVERQYNALHREIDTAYHRVMRSGSYILGAEVEAFEQEFAVYSGTKHAIGVASGFDALALAIRALGIEPGDEVITVSHTFISTALAILAAGAIPVFVDIDPRTLLMDCSKIKEKITPKTKAILPVHLYGNVADMDAIMAIARTHHLFVIEDACQAHGSQYRGCRAGSTGDVGCFSFYPSKNLGAIGDGGALVTNSSHVAKQATLLRNVGQQKKYLHTIQGYNSRLDEMQAAILRVKLRRLDQRNARRRTIADVYRTAFAHQPLRCVEVPTGVTPNYHLFVIEVSRRDELLRYLAKRGIETSIHYPTPVHLQPCMKPLGIRRGDLPITEASASRILSLPMFPELKADEIEKVVRSIQTFFQP